MIRLTQQQIAILASAQARPDGCATRPTTLKPAAAAKAAAKMIEQGLVRELRAKGDAPVWREDEAGKRFSLKILKAGRAAMATYASGDGQPSVAAPPTETETGRSSADEEGAGMIRGQTKRALILSLMGRDSGATLDELIAATGWLPHTTRAALTGLRKNGVQLERVKRGGVSNYQVRATPAKVAA